MSWIGGVVMLRKIREIKKILVNLPCVLREKIQYMFVHQKNKPQKPLAKVKRTREEM
jgi:hypothetical protein